MLNENSLTIINHYCGSKSGLQMLRKQERNILGLQLDFKTVAVCCKKHIFTSKFAVHQDVKTLQLYLKKKLDDCPKVRQPDHNR